MQLYYNLVAVEVKAFQNVNADTNLDFHGSGCQGSDLLLHTVSNARVHGGSSRQHSVGVQVLTDVHVTLHDAVEGSFMDTTRLHSCRERVFTEKNYF